MLSSCNLSENFQSIVNSSQQRESARNVDIEFLGQLSTVQ